MLVSIMSKYPHLVSQCVTIIYKGATSISCQWA